MKEKGRMMGHEVKEGRWGFVQEGNLRGMGLGEMKERNGALLRKERKEE